MPEYNSPAEQADNDRSPPEANSLTPTPNVYYCTAYRYVDSQGLMCERILNGQAELPRRKGGIRMTKEELLAALQKAGDGANLATDFWDVAQAWDSVHID